MNPSSSSENDAERKLMERIRRLEHEQEVLERKLKRAHKVTRKLKSKISKPKIDDDNADANSGGAFNFVSQVKQLGTNILGQVKRRGSGSKEGSSRDGGSSGKRTETVTVPPDTGADADDDVDEKHDDEVATVADADADVDADGATSARDDDMSVALTSEPSEAADAHEASGGDASSASARSDVAMLDLGGLKPAPKLTVEALREHTEAMEVADGMSLPDQLFTGASVTKAELRSGSREDSDSVGSDYTDDEHDMPPIPAAELAGDRENVYKILQRERRAGLARREDLLREDSITYTEAPTIDSDASSENIYEGAMWTEKSKFLRVGAIHGTALQDEHEADRDKKDVTLAMMKDAKSSLDRITCCGFNCNPHRTYQWMCWPYRDRWLPLPSKRVLQKTLGRVDWCAFDPFHAYSEYYQPYWSRPGILLTLGVVTLLVLYSIWAIDALTDNNPQQENTFPPTWAANVQYYSSDYAHPLNFIPAGSFAMLLVDGSNAFFNDSSVLTIQTEQVSAVYSRTAGSGVDESYRAQNLKHEATTRIPIEAGWCKFGDTNINAICPTADLSLHVDRDVSSSTVDTVVVEVIPCYGVNIDPLRTLECVEPSAPELPCNNTDTNSTCFVASSKQCTFETLLPSPGTTPTSTHACQRMPTSCSQNGVQTCFTCVDLIYYDHSTNMTVTSTCADPTVAVCRRNPFTGMDCNATYTPTSTCSQSSHQNASAESLAAFGSSNVCFLEEPCNYPNVTASGTANCTLSTRCFSECQSITAQHALINSAHFVVRGSLDFNETFHELLLNPVFNYTRLWPLPVNMTQTLDVTLVYKRVVTVRTSQGLRKDIGIEYVRFDHAVNRYTARTTPTAPIFRLTIQLDDGYDDIKLVQDTTLDTASDIGGMIALSAVLVATVAYYFVRETFNQSRHFTTDKSIQTQLLRMKSEELTFYKDTLTDLRVNEVMRIRVNEMYVYLNKRRNTELSTYRHAMADSLNIRKKKVQKDAILDPTRRDKIERWRERDDDLQVLVRQDELERAEHPELARMINVLLYEELVRRVNVLGAFIAKMLESASST